MLSIFKQNHLCPQFLVSFFSVELLRRWDSFLLWFFWQVKRGISVCEPGWPRLWSPLA
uniref:Uncharacterized protein n=1 Tax=Anguilla anguilla TaxID=7936 RepID=A0A0E9RT57_ANGAN